MLVTDAVYGPRGASCNNHLTRLGVEVTYYDPLLGAAIEREMRPNTRIVFTESPGSLTFCVQDIPAIAAVAHRRGALVITDNSWATPFGFRSFDHGVDVSVHAATKYIGGHSDVLLGLILGNEATFPGAASDVDGRGRHLVARRLLSSGCAGCARFRFVSRGMSRALSPMARWLQQQPEVREVIYPALPGSRGHELWKRDFIGASGLFAFVLQPVAKARVDALLDGMRLFGMGWSWGGFESLLIPIYPERVQTATKWDAGGPVPAHRRSASRIRTT